MLSRRTLFATPAIPFFAQVSAQAAPAKAARLRTAICAYSFRNELKAGTMKYDDLVNMAVELNVDGLDLTVYWFPNQSDSFLLPLRRLAYKNAVEIYSISVRTDLCKPAGEARDKELAELRGWVDTANKLGASHIRVFGGKVPQGTTEDQAAGWVADNLKAASDYSGSKGIILGLENHGGITAKADRVVQIVKAVNSPWVGINLDTGNFERDGYRQLETCLPYAVNSQVKVEIRDEKGERQKSDWDRILNMYAQAGYKGYLALEYEANDDARKSVPPLTLELNRLARRHSHPTA